MQLRRHIGLLKADLLLQAFFDTSREDLAQPVRCIVWVGMSLQRVCTTVFVLLMILPSRWLHCKNARPKQQVTRPSKHYLPSTDAAAARGRETAPQGGVTTERIMKQNENQNTHERTSGPERAKTLRGMTHHQLHRVEGVRLILKRTVSLCMCLRRHVSTLMLQLTNAMIATDKTRNNDRTISNHQ